MDKLFSKQRTHYIFTVFKNVLNLPEGLLRCLKSKGEKAIR